MVCDIGYYASMFTQLTLATPREGFVSLTAQIQRLVTESGVSAGYCLVFCPHTTAAITLNENSDPDVIHDLMIGLDSAFPDDSRFRHDEGNSVAHLKSSAIGASELVPIHRGKLVLGIWQDIYFCEFDGPRSRTVHVQIAGVS